MTKTTTLRIAREELRMIICKHFGLDPGSTNDLVLNEVQTDGVTRIELHHDFEISISSDEEVERPWESAPRNGE